MFISINDRISAGVSLSDVYSGLVNRIELINWLDPCRTGHPSPFIRPDIFAWPNARELIDGWQNIDGVRLVNCLNLAQTGFPLLSMSELKELFGGPYLLKLSPSYITSMRAETARNLPYVDIPTWHANHRALPANLNGFVFDQMIPPNNWNGVWCGCSTIVTKHYPD